MDATEAIIETQARWTVRAPCAQCGEVFYGRGNRRYCDESCRNRAKRERNWVRDRPHIREKKCGSCCEVLPAERFGREVGSYDGLYGWCKDCARRRRKNRPPEEKLRDRLARYGVTAEWYADTVALGCAICGETNPGSRDFHIDHDHSCCPDSAESCGACVRGILCRACNHLLGNARDRIETLKSAIQYLEGK